MIEELVVIAHGRRPSADLWRRGLHHVLHPQEVQGVRDVLAGHVIPAARDLLGGDRALHEEHGHGIGGDTRDEEPWQHVYLVRQLHHERDGGERGAHRAAHHRAHAERGPEPGVARGDPVRLEGAERAPHNEERCEHAAGRPRAEGHGPDHRLGHHEAEEGDADELPGEEVVDGVVADAQRTRVEQTAEPDHDAAQEGPPHPVHRDLAKQVLARIHEPREQPRSEAGGDPEGERDDEPVRGQRGVWRHRKEGPAPSRGTRNAPATAAAQATGMKLRGFHSNKSSSTASSVAASGVPNTVAIPPAAPATSNVFRSAGDRWNAWPNSEPSAPPVMMIGPSAPNGPPVPMEMAEDSGLSTATRADMRLCPMRIASSASGMPWPRIRREPYRAMSPTMRPPTMGTNSAQTPRRLSAGETRRLSIAW